MLRVELSELSSVSFLPLLFKRPLRASESAWSPAFRFLSALLAAPHDQRCVYLCPAR